MAKSSYLDVGIAKQRDHFGFVLVDHSQQMVLGSEALSTFGRELPGNLLVWPHK